MGLRDDARTLAAFLPHCATLLARILRDRRVARRERALVGGLVAYLAFPVDLVPDFVPVLGQLDDAILVALVLRRVLRSAGDAVIREHWPGDEPTLRVVLRMAR